jgi:hypothetical protein
MIARLFHIITSLSNKPLSLENLFSYPSSYMNYELCVTLTEIFLEPHLSRDTIQHSDIVLVT